jgi:hypothetical protein
MLGSSKAVALKATMRARHGQLARCWLVGGAIFIVSLCFQKTYFAAADNAKQAYKQYAWIQLNYDIDEFDCLDLLYTAESQWNPKARNGSHYGIPQGKSKWLLNADPYAQIRWGIKYNYNRYGTMCAAYEHHKLKGWH